MLAHLSSTDRLLAAPIVWGGKHVNVSDVLVFDNPGSKGDERRHVLLSGGDMEETRLGSIR